MKFIEVFVKHQKAGCEYFIRRLKVRK